ncbi:hypothetical protein [Martelella endophytica]|uniref:Uncharacterized protein n=1 Tax=Martelella endophytica TaxID=1486262 RepID=A0A0D5LV43_MAREN|nr:hypothetical protein [Martelella endophytica]AJY47637.1 hypothetical protein TM49_21330 [Martelella endophytica]
MAGEAMKRAIEERYAVLCARVEAAAGSDAKDDALREDFAELAAMMIAYAHETGEKEALDAALSLSSARASDRLSLAERARRLIDD